MSQKRYIIATIKPWNIEAAKKIAAKNKKSKFLILTNKRQLTFDRVARFKPRYIFFPHWSWIISSRIFQNYECVIFHMTDLPFGRGGSPLQNLIMKQIYNTKISAIKAGGCLDAGDIYLKRNLNIRKGSAEDILRKASKIIFFKMIPYVMEKEPLPSKQIGKVTLFKRRLPIDSNIQRARIRNLDALYDFIRMLDAEGYPKSYIKSGNIKIALSRVCKMHNKLSGRFEAVYEK